MTSSTTEQRIRQTAKQLFAAEGYEGVSMRTLAAASGVGLSSIYHFFADKDVLLQKIFEETNTSLGRERQLLKPRTTATQMLQDRIDFQFRHMEDVVFVLKYYLHYRNHFMTLPTKTLPAKSALHIEEVLHKGIATGEFDIPIASFENTAKIIAHSINGFLLEYYPQQPTARERTSLVQGLTLFVMRSLKCKQAVSLQD
jgi:AcrR family transcriptional regulator